VHSERAVPTHRSANAFARGDRGGILITFVSLPANTSSKTFVNFVPDPDPESETGTRRHDPPDPQEGHEPAGQPTPRPDSPLHRKRNLTVVFSLIRMDEKTGSMSTFDPLSADRVGPGWIVWNAWQVKAGVIRLLVTPERLPENPFYNGSAPPPAS
jgi:hypothetical protein